MRKLCFLICVFLFSHSVFSQVNSNDSASVIPIFQFTFGLQFPGGDMAEQYGLNFTVGGSFLVKTRKNVVLGLDGNFIFGSDVKDKYSILENISTDQGFIIDTYGTPANISIYERGFYLVLKGGRVFPVIGPNTNSGILVTLGAGWLQHKTRIENADNTVPQIQGDYEKGYDRLFGGPALNQFIGYLHLGNSRVINFMAGFEFVQSWTSSLRSYDFNLMGKDESKRVDLFFGIKVAWMIPIYSKAPDNYYYY